MATLQKIRNRGTLLMLIVGIALFAFIVGDAIQNSSSYFAQSANMVGEIDGEPISYEDYRKQVGINIQEAESQRGGLSSSDRNALELQTWNQMVERKIVGKEMEELGVKVTPDELSHIFTNKTDNTIQQAFGSASASEIAALVAETEASNDPASKAQLDRFKEYIKEKRANEKYFTLLSQGLKATKNLISESNVEGKVSFKYIMRSYTTIADSTVNVSDSEIKDYYNTHKELFKQVPSREIAYVKIDVEPSDEDKAYATKVIEDMKDKFANAKQPLRFASVNSEIQPNGRYLKEDEIQDAELAAFAFSGNEGVYGPYGDGLTLQLTRVADTKMLPDSVRASHILVAPAENTQQTVDSLMNLLEKGADFETLAKANSIDKNSAVNGGDLGWFKKGMMVPTFEQAAFETEAGKLTTVNTQFGTHIIKVAKRSALNKNVQLATITKETSASNKTFQLALTEARHIAESANSIDELRAVAKEKNIIVNESTFTAASMGLPDVDNSKELVRAAFKAEDEDKLIVNNNNSTVFEMEDSYIIAGLKKIREGEYASIDDEKVADYIKNQLRKDKKAQVLKEELANSIASANTLDALATKEGLEIQEATNATFNNSFVSGLGQEPAVVASAIFTDNSTNLSQPIKGNQGVFVLSDVTVDKTASSNSEQATLLYNNMLRQRVQMAYQALYENAEITDQRYKF
ncbi:peptidyl-prolyl cis-trans isomerase D [Balneicella halophila]|uniref:Periplasmic chaperone PpiD n=1 Tax=Balneicella halophila TaxID=1537566 RepID=A0A7L4UNX0_BALHA|nr:peptidylprolyl isomerase [Balneicella halophila]PVX50811.1 peptidyl-prolyl cis-trans isomerase D [Balneicella halophila]